MKQQNDIFFERQYLTLFILTMIISLAILLLISTLSPNKEEGMLAIAIVSVPLLIAVLLFYKMDTRMSDTELSVSFGIGLIKKSWKTNVLDFSVSKNMNAPWYYGIGIRILNDGLLYNAHHGDAIAFFNKETNRFIYIGTKEKANFKLFLNRFTPR
ncbi:hypothetical protein FLJC2902T_20710 [Flavobacterium limnosediminis JC2902]|uniref:Bacterial Pleckstrin homology domain-containing protein n=1 Tax=Flavobacterium limnosediminis JC2902 TaxID=1341181 RepID=V6SL88_9FLAO|nr:hypothetical protein [Flavobacterium limnosediminis]ESU27366.1 hypothetical protein FLJC2902T_20710 [Flavobacterium limnosediminis JC2902]